MRISSGLVFMLAVVACMATASIAHAQNRASIAQRLTDETDMKERYVYDDAQTVSRRVPVNLPVMADEDIQNWLIDHVAQIMSVTPTLYPAHKNKIVGFFTAAGWEQLMRQWQQAQIPELVSQQNYTMNAMVLDPPRVVAKGRQQSADPALAPFRWILDVPVLLTYTPPKEAVQTYNMSLRIGVTRIPMRKDSTPTKKGNTSKQEDSILIAIDEWGVTPAQPISAPDVPVVTP